jgi:hypothetical protein
MSTCHFHWTEKCPCAMMSVRSACESTEHALWHDICGGFCSGRKCSRSQDDASDSNTTRSERSGAAAAAAVCRRRCHKILTEAELLKLDYPSSTPMLFLPLLSRSFCFIIPFSPEWPLFDDYYLDRIEDLCDRSLEETMQSGISLAWPYLFLTQYLVCCTAVRRGNYDCPHFDP